MPRHHRLPYLARSTYTRAAHSRVNGVTFHHTDQQLRQERLQAEALVELTGRSLGLELNDLTTNTRTALSRLGVNPDDDIMQYMVCPRCWNLVRLDELNNLDTPICRTQVHSGIGQTMIECDGEIYTTKGEMKVRSPVKVLPVSPLSNFIAHLLEDEDVINHLQDWRDPVNDPIEDPHVNQPSPPQSVPPPGFSAGKEMKGMSDGLAWRAQTAYAKRSVRPDGSVEEVVEGPYIFRHSALKYGLKIILNLDWYVPRRGGEG